MLHGRGEGIELVVEEPGDAAAFHVHVGMAGEADLLHPAGSGDHAEVPDDNAQAGELGDNRFHFRNLQVSFGQFHVQDQIPVLHQSEHRHHLGTVQSDAAFRKQEPGGGNLDAPEAPADEFLRLGEETGLAELAHPEHEKALRIA